MPIDLSLAGEKPNEMVATASTAAADHQLVSPGDVITRDTGYMRGHGTYMKGPIDGGAGATSSSEAGVLYASVAGVVQRVNKLISVTPPRTKYQESVHSTTYTKSCVVISC